jgi:hypothetical protein
MTQAAGSATAGTALVICKDLQTRQLLAESLHALAISPEICDEVFAANRLLNRQKFEAVIVDLRLGEEAVLVMEQLRFSPANRTAVTFAITARDREPNPVGKPDSTFVLARPLSAVSINQTLRAAYGLMVRERRRYFRCPIAIPALVRTLPTEEIGCQTVNISEGGIAIQGPATLDFGNTVAVRFRLPDRSTQLFAETKVCWRGKAGLFGVEFQGLPAPQKSELQEWLARKLDETLPENVAALFRSATHS